MENQSSTYVYSNTTLLAFDKLEFDVIFCHGKRRGVNIYII